MSSPLDWSIWIDLFRQNSSLQIPRIQRQNVHLPNGGHLICFKLLHVISSQECLELISMSEKLGYKKLTEYDPKYRNNTRVMKGDTNLSDEIFNRVKHLLPGTYQKKGTWDVVGLNELFRFCKYIPGQKFGVHQDADYVRVNNVEQSFLTFMIYLNGGFDGGTTTFLCGPKEVKVAPEEGMVLVFQHEIWHEGEKLKSGFKYIMRTEVVYRLRNSTTHNNNNNNNNNNLQPHNNNEITNQNHKDDTIITLEWRHGGSLVFLLGSFNNWSKAVMCKLGDNFIARVSLKPEQKDIEYKFMVDFEWRTDPDQPCVVDSKGNVNNYLKFI